MYPHFEIFGIVIYVFGLTLTICFFLFLWMLKKTSSRFGSDFSFFTKNIIWYFLSVFIFSRLFYVISNWNDLKYIRNPFDFFIMSDYNFSLAGAIFGFFIFLFLHLNSNRLRLKNYIDPLLISFLFILFIAYLGAFFGGQVYGRETNLGIEILYSNSFSPVPYQISIFPLPIVYSIVFFILFSVIYILSLFVKVRGLLGYIGFISFGSIILILEFFSGKHDLIVNTIGINLIQIFSIFIIIISGYFLYKLLDQDNDDNKIIKNDIIS